LNWSSADFKPEINHNCSTDVHDCTSSLANESNCENFNDRSAVNLEECSAENSDSSTELSDPTPEVLREQFTKNMSMFFVRLMAFHQVPESIFVRLMAFHQVPESTVDVIAKEMQNMSALNTQYMQQSLMLEC
jgi:hypothetical protein